MDVDSWVTIRGQITVPPGIFGERTAYLQDKTGGIKLYLPEDHNLWAQVGERWEVTGHTRMYYGELEIRVSERGDVRTLETRDPLPPLPIGTGGEFKLSVDLDFIAYCEKQGLLVSQNPKARRKS